MALQCNERAAVRAPHSRGRCRHSSWLKRALSWPTGPGHQWKSRRSFRTGAPASPARRRRCGDGLITAHYSKRSTRTTRRPAPRPVSWSPTLDSRYETHDTNAHRWPRCRHHYYTCFARLGPTHSLTSVDRDISTSLILFTLTSQPTHQPCSHRLIAPSSPPPPPWTCKRLTRWT